MIQCSVGYLFDRSLSRVVLIEKQRPENIKGNWSPPGGKIEAGETPKQSLIREFEEETGIHHENWFFHDTIERGDYLIHRYMGITHWDILSEAETMTDERIKIFRVDIIQRGRLKYILDDVKEFLKMF